ncbi:PQQ-binding-like beta-propeller repeat protein [Candidatus Tisiphia endosymbiont of Nemotelus uliginosus]|uniref:outer membrane protein assembly factor BamB family protein n=1 Tax=Candidatus Tisiphia endosymbiont of Nemotelus uliginosus TaxID=3077926 RepID=UPI0035C93D75
MKKQLLAAFCLIFILGSCGIGSQKTKNITELTPKLIVEDDEVIKVDPLINDFTPKMLQGKEYVIATHQIIAEPILYQDVIYNIDKRGNVSAFSNKSKAIIWSYNISINKNDHYSGGGLLYHNGKLYVTYGSRFLVVLDSASGHEIIRKELPDIIRIKPILIDGINILVQTISNQILVMNIENLNFVWQHENMFETLSSSYHVAPIVQNGHIIVSYNSGEIVVLNRQGKVLWTRNISLDQGAGVPNFEASSIICKPVVHNSSLYIASSSGKLMKLNIIDGKILWHTKAEDIQSISLTGNTLFITNNAGQVGAVSTETGKIKFVASLISPNTKKLKASLFLAPIISKFGNGWQLNVISNKGELYSFQSDNENNLVAYPQIDKIAKNIGYYGKTMEGNMYFITDRKIIFVNLLPE